MILEKRCIVCGKVCPRTKTGKIRANAKYCSALCKGRADQAGVDARAAADPAYAEHLRQRRAKNYRDNREVYIERAMNRRKRLMEEGGAAYAEFLEKRRATSRERYRRLKEERSAYAED